MSSEAWQASLFCAVVVVGWCPSMTGDTVFTVNNRLRSLFIPFDVLLFLPSPPSPTIPVQESNIDLDYLLHRRTLYLLYHHG